MPTGILVKMLKKEKKRAQDAAAQLAKSPNDQSLASQGALKLSRDESTTTISADHEERAMHTIKRGTNLYIFSTLHFYKAIFTKTRLRSG